MSSYQQFENSNIPTIAASSFPQFEMSNIPTIASSSFPQFGMSNIPTMASSSFPQFGMSNIPKMASSSFPQFGMSNIPTMASNSFPQFKISNIPKLTMEETTGNAEVWFKTGYEEWSRRMKEYLLRNGLWDTIEPTISCNRIDYESWREKNVEALKAIKDSCDAAVDLIQGIKSANIAWDTLAKMHKQIAQGFVSSRINLGDLSKLQKQPTPIDPPFGEQIMLFDPERKRFGSLHKAILSGDWEVVKQFLDGDSEALTAKMSSNGSLPIHIAGESGQTNIVENLMKLMSAEDLEIQTSLGHTVLHMAALNGSVKMAESIIQKNKNLLQIEELSGNIPVLEACIGGHKDATHYLYCQTPTQLFYPENGVHGPKLLHQCIVSKMFDIALDLLRHCPCLCVAAAPVWPTLAGEASAFSSGCRLIFWERWIYSYIQVPRGASNEIQVHVGSLDNQNKQEKFKILQGIKQIYNLKLTHEYALEITRIICATIATLDVKDLPEHIVIFALFEAVRNGVVEYVVEMIKANPDLLNITDAKGRTIIMSSIKYRQENIFNLVYGLDARKYYWTTTPDNSGNTMLHYAGKLAPSYQLDRISGAALQMQRELQWYKEVESMMQPSYIEFKNKNGETASELFTAQHKELKEKGEEWMKETARSYTVVGALIITIMFAVAFTVPGGNSQDSGFPIFSYKKSFMVFIISDAVSLFASSTSVLMFLGVLTSRYAEKDFLKSLPTKLIIGLSTLFFSIASMMITFCATLTIILDGRFWIIIPIILLASIPVSLFIFLQFPLLVEIFIFTYGRGIFKKNMKRWY